MLDRTKYLSESEVASLLRAVGNKAYALRLEKDRLWYPRLVILRTLFATGLRATECRLLKVKDLNLKGEPSLTVVGKGGRKRTIPIPDDLRALLTSYLSWREKQGQSSDYVFVSSWGRHYSLPGIEAVFKDCCKLAGLPRYYSIHASRHSYATQVYRKGKNLRMVQNLLGHSSVNTTAIYSHVDHGEMVGILNRLW